jgi:hypothetical protein
MSESIPGGGAAPPPAPNANPDCPNIPDYSLCRVTRSASIVEPLIVWEPVYDGTGKMTNSDPNTHISTFTCETCSQMWEASNVSGEPIKMRKLPNKV